MSETAALPNDVLLSLRAQAEARGVAAVARDLGVNPATFANALLGRARVATVALIQQRLAKPAGDR